MFYTQKHKDNFKILGNMVGNQSNRIAEVEAKLISQKRILDHLFSRIENHINDNHPYGLKKDGTPKAKPGRKPK
jgi:hypothetical protein